MQTASRQRLGKQISVRRLYNEYLFMVKSVVCLRRELEPGIQKSTVDQPVKI
jgi:hypothetical protein